MVPGAHCTVAELVPEVVFTPPNSSITEEGPEGFETAFVDADEDTLDPCCWALFMLCKAFQIEPRAGSIAFRVAGSA